MRAEFEYSLGLMIGPESSPLTTQTFDLRQFSDSRGVYSYLLVIGASSSYRRVLPDDGVLVVGRSDEADLRLDTAAVSRRHAELVFSRGEIRITDLGSHNGTLVNGERVEGSRTLGSGDVITMGDTTLILRRESPSRGSTLIEMGRLRRRVEEEIERAADSARPFGLAVVSLGSVQMRTTLEQRALSALRLVDIVAWDGASHLAIGFPELGGESARAAALQLIEAIAPLVPEARGGLACYPFDGGDTETLLAGARTAASIAAPGTIASALETAVRHVIGERTVVVADSAMIRLFELIRRLAASDLPVLVLGETGAGKENAAAAVHHWSARAQKPMIALNCAALPETLVESELFGYEKGAFSEARGSKPGLLERAHGGTVFLDEIGELPLGAQAKLLRALEAKRITRLGDVRDREVDIRIVAATNRDLEAEVHAGRFRQDLLFRLSAAVVELPPLRHRRRELPILARLFLAEACARTGRPALELSEAALAALFAHPFPGNVRELKNAMEYAAATADGSVIEPWSLPERIAGIDLPPRAAADPSAPPAAGPSRFRPIAEELREIECTRMRQALDAAEGVQKRAAALLGMPVRTFTFKLKQYGISAREGKRSS
ncbi:sigma 54-interacting transcriptional regulator [Sorangium sp. So ce260]|uniref:sigma 54-interacting transcriptional regulator n=1 Tax=Sorangium sp. So ce260 TaxID=3133291 RepID=UPI003F60EC7B